ncbi:unnamed protein product [Meganyctiphanes norvegica]|uniref:Uncharacterized protein n=1 Tax=Meganyctiphanes norvegica TaxID=48144 RepID=A0AAV2QPU8_MEGNR
MYGINGQGCLLRFICELQKYPIKDFTIAGEILTSLFTPRSDRNGALSAYREAEMLGQLDEEDICWDHYGVQCPLSVFSFFDDGQNYTASIQ